MSESKNTTNVPSTTIPITLPIPDLRFESTFRKSLDSAFQSSNVKTNSTEVQPLPFLQTTYIITKVIIKDVILMPLIQGFALSYFLLGFKPWLNSHVVPFGRKCGIYLMNCLKIGSTSYRESGLKRI